MTDNLKRIRRRERDGDLTAEEAEQIIDESADRMRDREIDREDPHETNS